MVTLTLDTCAMGSYDCNLNLYDSCETRKILPLNVTLWLTDTMLQKVMSPMIQNKLKKI